MSEPFNTNDLNDKFAEISEILQALKEENASKLDDTNRIVNNLCENVNKDEVISKITNLETIVARIAGDYDVSLHSVHENIMEYLANIKDDCESADIKMNNFAFEFNSLKSEFSNIFTEFKSLYGSQNDNFSSICNGIYSRFDNVMNAVSTVNEQPQAFAELKEGLYALQNLMKELLIAIANNSSKPVEFDVNTLNTSGITQENLEDLLQKLDSRFNKLKDQISFVSSDLMENLYNYYEKLSQQFKPVQEAVLKFSEIDIEDVISKITAQCVPDVETSEEKSSVDTEVLMGKVESLLKEAAMISTEKVISALNNIQLSPVNVNDVETEGNATPVVQAVYDVTSLTDILELKLSTLKTDLETKFENIHKHFDEAVIPRFADIENKQNELLSKFETIDDKELLNSLKSKLDELSDKFAEINLNSVSVPQMPSPEVLQNMSDEEKAAFWNFSSGLNEIKNLIKAASDSVAEKMSAFSSDNTDLKVINQKLDLLALSDDVKDDIESSLAEIKNTVKDQQKFLNTVNILEALSSLEDINKMKGIEQLSKLSNIISVEKLNALNKLTLLENLQNLDRINELENIPKLSGMIDLQNKLKTFVEDLDKKLDALSDNSAVITDLSEKVKTVISNDFKGQIAEIEDKFVLELANVKSAIMKHVLNVFEQLSFVVEGEEIKDFVDEKAQEIVGHSQNILNKTQEIYDVVTKKEDVSQEIKTLKHAIDSIHPLEYKDIEDDLKNINDVTGNISNVIDERLSNFSENLTAQVEHMEHQFNQMRVGSDTDDGSYSYSMQDVESDIAHLRLAMNNIKTVVEENSLKEITQYVNEIVQQVESMKFNISQDDIFKIKVDVEKILSDIMSLSSRTNKLLLASDESALALSTAMDSFKQIMSDIYDGMKKLDYTEITDNLDTIKDKAEDTNKQTHNTVETLAKLSLWADNADERLTDVSDTLDKLKKAMPSNESVLDELETKFAKQQQRIEALEDKLDELIAMSSERDESSVSKKLNDIDKQLTRLNRSIERLTSYVDEE